MMIKKIPFVLVGMMALISCSTQTGNGGGSVVFDTLASRPLQIYLPPDYDPNRTYPVAYFHDGQNLFLDSTSYLGEWGIDEIVDSLIQEGAIQPMLIVGIYNSPQRAEEYVPFNDPHIMQMMGMESWNGALHLIFADFILLDLLPYIEEKYNASSAREDRGIFGSSFGGLNALWLGLDYSNDFSFVGALSPSCWVGDGAILRDIEIVDSIPDDKVWIDQGELEWDERNLILVKDLEAQGLTYGENLWYYEDKGAAHNEPAWRSRVAYPLLLFKGLNPSDNFELAAELIRAQGPDSTEIVRINALCKRADGVKYSLLDEAAYEGIGMDIDPFGTLGRNPEIGNTVEVSYRLKSAKIEF